MTATPDDGAPNPLPIYLKRHGARAAVRQAQERLFDRIGNARLAMAVVTVVLVLLPLTVRQSWPWWCLIPMGVAFLVLGRWHDKVSIRLRRARAAEAYYRGELDRLEERWRSLPEDGATLSPAADEEREASPEGLLAVDLDLFGPASLYQLLCRAVTGHGRRTLARWLLEPADLPTILQRQAAVRETAAQLESREALAVAAGGDGQTPLRDGALLEWAEKVDPLPAAALLKLLGVLMPAATITTAIVYFAGGPGLPLGLAAIAHVLTIGLIRRPVESRAAKISTPDRTLSRYADLIEAIEGAGFESEALVAQVDRLRVEGASASDQIRAMRRLVDLLDARLNVFFSLSLGPLLLWDLNLVLRAERWQRTVGGQLRGWFEAIGEIEALASLGAFAYGRPDYVLPTMTDEAGMFAAKALAHPLIDRDVVAANDITLGGPGSVLLLSGSNMSGKSTFLRSVGIAVVLAQAGAPVPALALTMGTMTLVTSIRVTDSLARGTSHFYAELERIRHTLDAAKASGDKLLYLLDEMLHGTNSRERYIGAASVIRWLSEHRASGIVTTHDLALAKVAGELEAGRLVNKHFGDDVDADRITFDYALKDGPVKSTNALRLMRAVGIDIELIGEPAS